MTKKDDGIYTFAMPKGKVTVSATFVKEEAPVVMPFVDVPKMHGTTMPCITLMKAA